MFVSSATTIVITLTISVYVYFTQSKLNIENGLVYTAISYVTLVILLVCNIGMINNPINLFYNFLGALFYGYALLNDVEKILNKNNFECDDYIIEAMMFYIHILNLFYKILMLFVSKKNK